MTSAAYAAASDDPALALHGIEVYDVVIVAGEYHHDPCYHYH